MTRESELTPSGVVAPDPEAPSSMAGVAHDRASSGKKSRMRLFAVAAAVLAVGAGGAVVAMKAGLMPGPIRAALESSGVIETAAAEPPAEPEAPAAPAPAEPPAAAPPELAKAEALAEPPSQAPPPEAEPAKAPEVPAAEAAAPSPVVTAPAAEGAAPSPAATAPAATAPAATAPAAAAPAPAAPAGASGVPAYVSEPVVLHLSGVALRRAQRCHPNGHAVGTSDVFITFGPDGHVSNARIEGEPIASAPVAQCVLLHARSIILPKFAGEPFTLRQQITLN